MNFSAKRIENIEFLSLHKADSNAFPFLLESVAGRSATGRFDLLAALPGEALRGAEVFSKLSAEARSQRVAADPSLPFLGGWFLLLGYESVRFLEPKLQLPPSPFALPDSIALRCRGALLKDHVRGQTLALAESAEQLEQLLDQLESVALSADAPAPIRAVAVEEEDPGQFVDGVERVLEYLRQGDAFQVNLSRAWRAQFADPVDPVALYRRLRETNPAPFAGLAHVDSSWVLSSSPERLVQAGNGRVQTRPIAGTRPRNIGAEDALVQSKLIGNPKERAEHIMLIDLERNDLGRICRPGSIEVDELMRIESYAHVHHIVSNVSGQLREDVGPGEILRAVFPGGTITGCPKVRAMEIIAELEGVGRGPYTGSMGYLSRCGQMDSNILIRSLVVEGSTVSFRAGAGIVADSSPMHELGETRAKARGMLLALDAEGTP